MDKKSYSLFLWLFSLQSIAGVDDCKLGANLFEHIIEKSINDSPDTVKPLPPSKVAVENIKPNLKSKLPAGSEIKTVQGKGSNMRLEISTPDGKKGYISYSYVDPPKNETLLLDKIELDPGLRGNKLSSDMYQHVLASNPNVKSITGTLDKTNLEAYQKALAEGKPPLQALKETPAYKARAKAGFVHIDESRTITEGFSPTLVTSKEPVVVAPKATSESSVAPKEIPPEGGYEDF